MVSREHVQMMVLGCSWDSIVNVQDYGLDYHTDSHPAVVGQEAQGPVGIQSPWIDSLCCRRDGSWDV